MSQTLKNSLLTGYASVHSIPAYENIMPLLRMNRAFATLGFLVKHEIWEGGDAYLYHANRHFLETFFK